MSDHTVEKQTYRNETKENKIQENVIQENRTYDNKTYANKIQENVIKDNKSYNNKTREKELRNDRYSLPSSEYLIACRESTEEKQKELLYRILGPIFFGKKAARTDEELIQLFQQKYGIDVKNDFYEGDNHYEEYVEAQNAIAEGYSIYGGSITFEEGALAELAEQVWDRMEEQKEQDFRRINTMLEE